MSQLSRRKFLGKAGIGVLTAVSGWGSTHPQQPIDSAPHDSWSKASQILDRIHPPLFPQRSFQITDYGAKAGEASDSRSAILEAISQCSAQGGGRVIVPVGVWQVDGPIHLKGNVHLHLEDGATIRFSSDPDRYLPLVLTRWEGIELYNYSPLIYTYEATNVAITGRGTIDGNAKENFAKWKSDEKEAKQRLRQMGADGAPVRDRVFGKGHWLRPGLIQFFGCKNVLLDGLTLIDSPFWVVHPVYSQNVTVRNLHIDSRNSNNDGVDPDSTVDVLIENCVFNTGDDSVAIKSGRDQDAWRIGQASENVIIRNCTLNSKRSGLCIGSEMSAGVRNVFIENCQIGKVASGIYVKSNPDRGGIVEQVHVRDVTADQAETFIHFSTDYSEYRGGKAPPIVRDVVVENATCQQAKNGISAVGLAGSPLREIVLRDVTIQQAQNPYELRYVKGCDLQNVRINGKLAGCNGTEITI